MPPARCPLCEALGPLPHLDSHPDSGIRYELYECPACHAQWWEPLQNPGAAWYERDERYAGRNSDPILEANQKHKKTIAFLAPRRGSVLDIGCGVGNFLAYAQKRGWECSGIDFDRDAIEAGKRTFGLAHLEVNDLEGFIDTHLGQTFDLVTFFDVFEHIDDHNEFIGRVRRLVKPGGSIALSVPYRRGWRWLMPGDLPPRHLTRWDVESLSAFLERHGFSVSYRWRLPASFYFIVIKLRFRYGGSLSWGLVQKAKAGERAASGKPGAMNRPSLRVRLLHKAAQAKDIILFGIPAGILWLGLLFTDKRYTDFLLIAQRSD